ncbi:CHAT domain-containing protein [Oscillatoria salina]|uniref:CHAT domain-containing protein n=1 Tax=Oscillatoria salina TaxID=331517 RepID=UPI0013B69CB4|nr:CHAT domain-containing protein [Oscillatoria salina]MBZ8179064.1 CHAT domain-containing protein [Oscillatoria salina IIICB1]NET88800.1 CHAT domain-containing protein [Kamptonema sp. SIO1D9]
MRKRKFFNYKPKLILLVCLFILAVGIQPVVAQVKNSAIAISQAQVTAYQLIDRAKTLLQERNFPAAVGVLQQAAEEFARQGDVLNQAAALSNLAATYKELGEISSAQTNLATSLSLLQNQPQDKSREIILAQTLDIQGDLQLAIGQGENALETWQKSAQLYHQIEHKIGESKSKINQSQALQNLGLYPRACDTLFSAFDIDITTLGKSLNLEIIECDSLNELTSEELVDFAQELLKIIGNYPDPQTKIIGLHKLGDLLLKVVGNLELSETIYQESLRLNSQFPDLADLGTIYLSLGNAERAFAKKADGTWIESRLNKALEYYQQGQELSSSPNTKIKAHLNKFNVFIELERYAKAEEIVTLIQQEIEALKPTKIAVQARINFARNLEKLQQRTRSKNPQEIELILQKAAEIARKIGDKRGEAYAIGEIGKIYEITQQLDRAETITLQALNIAPAFGATDITYQYLWQLGRIQKAKGDRKAAIASISEAVKILDSLGIDLVNISTEARFDFQERVEPVYRQLVDLLLQPEANVTQADIIQARKIIESHRLAELNNFFQDNCVNTRETVAKEIDQIDPTAAVFSTIILPDRLEVIVALPGKPLRHYATFLPQNELENQVLELRDTIFKRQNRFALQLSQEVYNWLIRPIETELAASNIKTLVFVLDGVLRNIPMAVMHDSEQYLIEKYSIAIAPGLQLIDPQPLQRQEVKIIMAGLSEARQGFSALPGVELELEKIDAIAPNQLLFNQSFTKDNFEDIIDSLPFPVVHVATHGQFSSQAEDTFILTWSDRINANELDTIIRKEGLNSAPIELLVLSACQTAAGDKRAALGLAGVAVKAGARSTLASLWLISDLATTELMTRFYQELTNSEITKAEALRRAQVAVLQDEKFSVPYFWGAFVLVGNWL